MDLSFEGLQLWFTRRAFNKERASFYRDLGSALDAQAPIKDLVTEYATQGIKGISPMMALWEDGMRDKPDSLAHATEGLVTAGDTVVISAAEINPNGAGKLYGLYAKNLAQRDQMVRAVVIPLISPAITAVFLVGILFFFRYMIYADMVANVPLKYWPFYAAYAYNTTVFLTGTGGLAIGLSILGVAAWITWSMGNLVGPARDWLDRHIVPWSTAAHMELLSILIAIASMIAAGVADTVAMELVSTRGSRWLGYQMDKIKRSTGAGKTVLTSLHGLPLPKMLAARVYVLARQEKLADALPGLVIDSCLDEATVMVERIGVISKFVTAASVLVLMSFVALLMLGNIGYSEASQNMTDAMARIH